MKSEIVESFSQMVKDKKIDRDLLESIIKEVFGMMIKKKFGQNIQYDVIVNMDKGDIEMQVSKAVVETVADPETEITLAEANERSGEELEVGDDYTEVLDFVSFGRRHIVNLKQNLNQKIREVEKEIIYNDYKDLVGEIVVGEIYQIKPHSILLIHNGHEIQFPKGEQIPKERYKKGESLRVYVKEVSKKSAGPPSIIVSRAADEFLKKLFELEIPEIYDGVIDIKGIAREPGERAKVAVYSYDDRIDAVGACVGMKGIRIHSIVRELANENIDVINFSEDIGLYIARALAPAKLKDIYLDKANKVAKIVADEDQISLVIGKNGQNIKLASKLTDYEIDVERNSGRPKDIEEALERELEREAEEAEEEELNEAEDSAESEDENIPELPKDLKDKDAPDEADDEEDDEEENEDEGEEEDNKGNKKVTEDKNK